MKDLFGVEAQVGDVVGFPRGKRLMISGTIEAITEKGAWVTRLGRKFGPWLPEGNFVIHRRGRETPSS